MRIQRCVNEVKWKASIRECLKATPFAGTSRCCFVQGLGMLGGSECAALADFMLAFLEQHAEDHSVGDAGWR